MANVSGLTGMSRIKAVAVRFTIKEAVIKASMGSLTLADLSNIEVFEVRNGVYNVAIRTGGLDSVFLTSAFVDNDLAIAVAIQDRTDAPTYRDK
jgi:phosphopantetheinyl transferase (holo-ACP synthase)